MPDPLDVSPDAARSQVNDPDFDPTGIGPMMDIMRTAFQIMTAARASGFSPDQSFQMAHGWFLAISQTAMERGE